MATIYALPNAKEWEQRKGESFDDYWKRQEALFKAIPADKIISFGVADGAAQYYVQSLKPLVICHIPYADAYRADRLIEKALNVTETKRLLKQVASYNKLFERKS